MLKQLVMINYNQIVHNTAKEIEREMQTDKKKQEVNRQTNSIAKSDVRDNNVPLIFRDHKEASCGGLILSTFFFTYENNRKSIYIFLHGKI